MPATARANSNIAFIKYWGNADHDLRLPLNPTLSMNLDGLYTETTVTWDENLTADTLNLNGKPADKNALERVAGYLDQIRTRYGVSGHASVTSMNNFPTGGRHRLVGIGVFGTRISSNTCRWVETGGSGTFGAGTAGFRVGGTLYTGWIRRVACRE